MKTYNLTSPYLDFTRNFALTFAYRFNLQEREFLSVEVENVSGFHSIWRVDGSQSVDWKTTSLSVAAAYRVRIVAGSDQPRPDIAVDDIQMSTALTTSTTIAATSTTTSTITIAPHVHASCSFEDQCPWTNEGEISWTVHSGQTPSSGTGPSAAATGANYVYVEASSPNNPNKIAIFKSPVLDATQSYTLTFAYHMKGSSMGSLDVEVGDAHGAFHSIWRKAGSQGDDWKTASMQINSTSVAVRLVAITGGWSSDIAVDDIQLTLVPTTTTTTIISSTTTTTSTTTSTSTTSTTTTSTTTSTITIAPHVHASCGFEDHHRCKLRLC